MGEKRARCPRRAGRLGGLLLLAALLLLEGCSTTYQRRDWSTYTGPGAEYFQREELELPYVADPLEPMNRVLAGADYQFTRYVLGPVCAAWRDFVPKQARAHLYKAGENLLFPVRFLTNALQWKWTAVRDETERFVVNTTVGVLGLWDPATKMGLREHPEDFGQVFATWGWKDSTYLYLPGYGPNTIRDGVGKVPDELSDPLNYFFPAAWVRRLNRVSDEIEPQLRRVEGSYDLYEPARTLFTLNRQVEYENFSWKRDESAATQTVESLFLSFEDPGFPQHVVEGHVRIPTTKRILKFSTWVQPKPSPLVYIVSGSAGHRMSDATLSMAEIFFQHGNSVVTVSNPSNWEFIENAGTVDVPGYAPDDALDLHRALTAIDGEMERTHPGAFTSRRLSGISLGAFLTLFIAAREPQAVAEGLLPFDVYLAMDVPVSFEHAMQQLDRFYNAPLVFPAEEREQRIAEILAKVLYLNEGRLDPSRELPFTQLEAQFLIGLSFRIDLESVILQSQERHDMGVLLTPRSKLKLAPAFREASEYSFMEYMYAFVLPSLHQRPGGPALDDAGAEQMFERCDLHSIAAGLRANDKIRLFANENDFLLRDEDRAWLRELLGDRAHFFPAGGHLGNLHRKTIQEIIQSVVERAADGAH